MAEFYNATDIQGILKISSPKAYEIIRQLNDEMEQEGYMVLRGKVDKRKFEQKFIYQAHSM